MNLPSPGSCPRAAAVVLCVAIGGCGPAVQETDPAASRSTAEATVFLEGTDSTRWVTIYDPGRAWSGYTLALYGRRIPMLIDMNGRVVHSWPEARVKSRVRLLDDCSLLGLALGRAIVEYDWEGNLTWEVPIAEAIPHHDVIRLENDNTMVLVLREGERTDDILEIDRSGAVVWDWRSGVHLADFYDPDSRVGEITHLNSVQELPPNQWFEAGDDRFRPGNLLISARNLNAVFVIDRATKEVVWSYNHQLDRQHEALMIERPYPSAGKILIFDNGYASSHRYRASKVLEVDPTDNSIAWTYEADGFYSPTGGVEQPLPNGNVLVSSTRGARAFEITRAGQIVWHWTPPFQPNRPSRVAYDHCPQLASLPRPRQASVRPASGYRYVDPPAYVYARPNAIAKVRIDGVERRALKEKNSCARVLAPRAAEIRLGYGINGRGAGRSGRTTYRARFGVAVRTSDGSADVLLSDVLDLEQATWREKNLSLDPYALRWVDICLTIEGAGPASETEPTHFAFWTDPAIVSELQQAEAESASTPVELTPEEAEVQRKHLRALGYID
ncbi:MAG: arylsulfotransferase family protein [Thermoanaerobaculia bacterium]